MKYFLLFLFCLVQHDEDISEGLAQSQRTGELYGSKVKIVLTEVVNDQNIKYLNTDDDDDPGVELYVTQAFATGTCLAVSVLDSILSTAYYNHQVLTEEETETITHHLGSHSHQVSDIWRNDFRAGDDSC